MSEYGFYLTPAGEALASQVAASGVKLELPSFAIGDGIWLAGEQRSTLKHQLGEPIAITEVADGLNPMIPLLTLVFPLTLGEVVINEIAIHATDPNTNELVVAAISKTPRTYLPDATSSPWVTEQHVKVDINFGYEGVVEVRYQPLATATIEYVNAQDSVLVQQLQAAMTEAFSQMTAAINEDQREQNQKIVNKADASHTHPDKADADHTHADFLGKNDQAKDSERLGGKTALEFAPATVVQEIQSLFALVGDLDDATLDTLPEIIAYIKRNRANIESAAPSWNVITNKPEQATRWPNFAELGGLPASFTPSAHNHDSVYLGKNHVAADSLKLGGKSASLYALKSEIPESVDLSGYVLATDLTSLNVNTPDSVDIANAQTVEANGTFTVSESGKVILLNSASTIVLPENPTIGFTVPIQPVADLDRAAAFIDYHGRKIMGDVATEVDEFNINIGLTMVYISSSYGWGIK